MKKPKPVCVVWHDAVSDDGWKDNGDPFEPPHKIHTLGFLLHEDDHKIVVAMQLDIDRDGYSMEMTIPRGMIISIKRITCLTLVKNKLEKRTASRSRDTAKRTGRKSTRAREK